MSSAPDAGSVFGKAIQDHLDVVSQLEGQQALLETQMRLPQLAVIHVLDALPDARFAAVLMPSGAEVAVIEPEHLRRKPGGNMDSVGDMPDGNGVFRLVRVEAFPHGPADVPVQSGNSIGAA